MKTGAMKTWLTSGLFLASLILLFILMIAAVVVRVNALSNLARLLPAEETEGFLVVNREEYPLTDQERVWLGQEFPWLEDSIGQDLSWFGQDLAWLGQDAAVAVLNGEWLAFFEIRSKREVEDFLAEAEAERGAEVGDLEWDFGGDGLNTTPFLFWKNFLVLAQSEEALALLQKVEAGADSVASTTEYQNVRGRLPSFNGAFLYLNRRKAQASLSEIFPTFGASVQITKDEWVFESFTAVDKQALAERGQNGLDYQALLPEEGGIPEGGGIPEEGDIPEADWIFDGAFFEEWSILNLPSSSEFVTSRKLFDDGVYIQTRIQGL